MISHHYNALLLPLSLTLSIYHVLYNKSLSTKSRVFFVFFVFFGCCLHTNCTCIKPRYPNITKCMRTFNWIASSSKIDKSFPRLSTNKSESIAMYSYIPTMYDVHENVERQCESQNEV